ncbi:CynX/NimT family MFS transporter [Hydrogenophaga sp. R2]|uniref:MFS transporter n=1 Tax=Hydrogenophaga sp. R2 TaxID=3132827 RepID=UPI003CF4EA81
MTARPSPPAHHPAGATLVLVSGLVAALHIGKMPPSLPVLAEGLGVTLLQAGFLLSVVQLAGMLGGLLVGLLADGAGLRRSVVTGQAVLALASLGGLLAQGPTALLALRALEGLGFLLACLPAPSLIRRLVAPERLSLHLGLWGTYMPTGTAVALLLAPPVLHLAGWRGLWSLLALASAAMAVWLWRALPADPARTAEAGTGGLRAWAAPLRATLAAGGPWAVALAFAMYSSQWMAVIGFLPTVYAQAGIAGTAAGALTALASLVNVAGNVSAGRLLHAGWPAQRLLLIGFVAMGSLAVLAFGQLPDGSGLPPLARFAAVLGFSMVGGLVPATLFSLAVRVAPGERAVSTTVGWVQQWSSAGQFAGPPLVAWVAAQTGGWQFTWVVTTSAAVLGVLLALGLERLRA